MKTLRLPTLLAATALLAACAAPPAGMAPARGPAAGALGAPAPAARVALPAIAGRVAWGGLHLATPRTTIAERATVALLDPDGHPVGAGLTTGTGNAFTVHFLQDATGTAGDVYTLEVSRGIESGRAGSAAGRMRTLVKLREGGWDALTPGEIVVSAATTAVAVAADLKNQVAPTIGPGDLIGKLAVDGMAFTDVTGLVEADVMAVKDLVQRQLGRRLDPVATIALTAGGWWARGVDATSEGLDYASGAEGRELTLAGSGFSPVAADNVVTFDGVEAEVTAATADQLTLKVPAGLSGRVRVLVRVDGRLTDVQSFEVLTLDTILGGFVEQGARLGGARRDAMGVQRGLTAYVVGGRDGGEGAYDSVVRVTAARKRGAEAPYAIDEVAVEAAHLATTRYGGRAVLHGDRLYVLGGVDDAGVLTGTVEAAPIDADGHLGDFEVVGADPRLARRDFGCFAADGALWVVGGRGLTGAAALAADTVVRLPFGPDDALDVAAATTSDAAFPYAGAAYFEAGGDVWAAGGADASGDPTAELTRFHAAGGALTATADAMERELDARKDGTAVVVLGRLHLFGGTAGSGLAQPVWTDFGFSGVPDANSYFRLGNEVGPRFTQPVPTLVAGDEQVFTLGGSLFGTGATDAIYKASPAERPATR